MSKDTKTELLMQELRKHYSALDAAGEVEIDPAYLAFRATQTLDPESASPILMSWAAVLELRQLARSICRGKFVGEAKRIEAGQEDMFDGLLQDRYPCHRNKRDVYVLRAHMTRDEYEENIARLTNEAVAKQRHSDALRAELELRDSRGDFDIAA